MFCGVVKDGLLVRVGAERNEETLALPTQGRRIYRQAYEGVHLRRLKGMVKGCCFEKWVDMGIEYVSTLPKK